MAEQDINSYRFGLGEEPSDEMLGQIMKEAVADARMKGSEAWKNFFEELKSRALNIRIETDGRASQEKPKNITAPQLIIVAGPNGSGKTTFTRKFMELRNAEEFVYINADQIAKDKFGDWNNQESILQAARYCKELRDKCLGEHQNFVFETVFSAADKIDFTRRAKEIGYSVTIFFISTSNPAINAARVARRVMEGGHDVPISKIISRYPKSILNCLAVSREIDHLYVFDNSIDDAAARLLFKLSEGRLIKRYVDNIPEWASLLLPNP